jgi:hypothetical protein
MTANEPMSQAMMAAGPPMVAQASAPKSQPEPMIEPSEVSSSPKNPMLRVRPSPVEADPSSIEHSPFVRSPSVDTALPFRRDSTAKLVEGPGVVKDHRPGVRITRGPVIGRRNFLPRSDRSGFDQMTSIR